MLVPPNVLYVPNRAYNLIFISQARKNGYRAIVDTDDDDPNIGRLKLLHKHTNDAKMVGKEFSGLYHADERILKDSAKLVLEDKIRLWHERLGQCSHRTPKKSITKVIGIDKNKIDQYEKLCKACVLGKITRDPRKLST